MLSGLSKAVFRIWDEKGVIGTLDAAVRAASTAPTGPVSLEIPIDVQHLEAISDQKARPPRTALPPVDEDAINQLAELVRERINPSLEFVFEPLPQDDPLQRQPVITLAQQQLDWTPSVPLAAGLDHTIADFRARLSASEGVLV